MLNFLQRILAFLVALGLIAAALVFASLILAIAAAIALVLGGWLWWRTRALRRDLKRQAEEGRARSEGAVIEGEYRRIDER